MLLHCSFVILAFLLPCFATTAACDLSDKSDFNLGPSVVVNAVGVGPTNVTVHSNAATTTSVCDDVAAYSQAHFEWPKGEAISNQWLSTTTHWGHRQCFGPYPQSHYYSEDECAVNLKLNSWAEDFRQNDDNAKGNKHEDWQNADGMSQSQPIRWRNEAAVCLVDLMFEFNAVAIHSLTCGVDENNDEHCRDLSKVYHYYNRNSVLGDDDNHYFQAQEQAKDGFQEEDEHIEDVDNNDKDGFGFEEDENKEWTETYFEDTCDKCDAKEKQQWKRNQYRVLRKLATALSTDADELQLDADSDSDSDEDECVPPPVADSRRSLLSLFDANSEDGHLQQDYYSLEMALAATAFKGDTTVKYNRDLKTYSTIKLSLIAFLIFLSVV